VKTIKRKLLRVKCPVCKSLVEVEPGELKEVQIDDYLDDEYWKSRIFKAFICPECSRIIYHRWFGWRDWEKRHSEHE